MIKCTRCSISIGNDFKPCNRDGDRNDILFIGEAPGSTENRLKRPFTGKSGLHLRLFLTRYDLTIHSSITNVVKCQPPQNRDPTSVEIANCKEFLFEDIAEVKPKLIILVGKVPLSVFIGKPIELAKPYINKLIIANKVMILPIYHPSYIIRNNLDELYFDSFNIISDIYHSINPYYKSKKFVRR